jgi:hypothetical protein
MKVQEHITMTRLVQSVGGMGLLNVWAGIIINRLIAPCILPGKLTASRYCVSSIDIHVLLSTQLPCCLHTGAPVYFSLSAREWLGRQALPQTVDRFSSKVPVSWILRSPDLNSVEFTCGIPWKMLHTRTPNISDTRQQLRQRTQGGANEILVTATVFRHVRDLFRRRADASVHASGKHLERLFNMCNK